MRTLIPCYGTGPGILVTNDDYVVAPGRVAHKHPDGSWVRIEPDGTVGSTPATAPAAAYETAAVDNELRIYCPLGAIAYGFRMTDPNSVPNV
jgi:hypothetical protein